ncbi:hypothetical protein GYMLUDRAFT_98447 [Collybiopsis luxurians FD-317 M1]|uniref:L-ornithine N(5)-monooxygenase [NAD(P)H] n=1 Tax=Collybiopsis luxurians FD-317 M1 TaxID=944289 RepID=A0A0D0CQH6_9AGAR|nr:hypothetical protein GYMLUDRAFT_98447 [Collybiopsis luxurians FD-317 M1]
MTLDQKAPVPNVVIVGAGLAGISVAVALKKQLGFENFIIYEKASALGGTWRDNTYPGCGSDVPGHYYSLSSELNPNWNTLYATQPEIRAYWENIYHKYNLSSYTKFNSMVTMSVWNNDTQRYSVQVTDTVSGEITSLEANVMFYAIGGFQKPVFSADAVVPGADSFKGLIWHSARYRHDVELKGKRVGVVGNGCSGAQLVPAIAVDPDVQVTNFCRTPQWIVPRNNYAYPRWVKWIFANVPLIMRWYRNLLAFRSDLSFVIFRKTNTRIVALIRRLLTKYISKMAPKSEVKNLIPSYPVGCKRIIVDPQYLESLNWPNVRLNWNGIERIVEDGIKLRTGEVVPLDVIIFATGYSVDPEGLDIRGSMGTSIREYHESQGGPTAYLGCSAPGFPNLFVLLGPNAISGSTSAIFVEEAQIGLALKLMKPVLEGKLKSVEVRQDVSEKYNEWLQGRLKDSVWTSCNSYYHRGGDKNAKIIATFPGPATLLYWLLRKAERWDDWKVVEAEKGWIEQQKWNKRRNIVLSLSSVIGVAVFWFSKL